MIRRIRTADDLTWLLAHTQAFPGGQITTLSVQKQRVFDEASGREITAGTAITTTIRYELAVRGMLPKTKLGKAMAKKLKVYADGEHRHTAQKPEMIEIDTEL